MEGDCSDVVQGLVDAICTEDMHFTEDAAGARIMPVGVPMTNMKG